jgi:hypothetical protein
LLAAHDKISGMINGFALEARSVVIYEEFQKECITQEGSLLAGAICWRIEDPDYIHSSAFYFQYLSADCKALLTLTLTRFRSNLIVYQ